MSEACHARNAGLPSPQDPQSEAGCQNSSRCARSRRRCLNLNRCLNRCLNHGDQSCLLRHSSRCVDLQPYLRCEAAGRWCEQRTSVRAGFVILLMYVLSRLSVRVSLAIRRVWYLAFSLLTCIGNRLTITFSLAVAASYIGQCRPLSVTRQNSKANRQPWPWVFNLSK